MYFDTNRATGTAAVVTITTVGTTTSRTWKVKVRTLECSSTSLASAGCLQWFTGLSGRITSLNSGAMAPIIQQGLNYNICIRNEKSKYEPMADRICKKILQAHISHGQNCLNPLLLKIFFISNYLQILVVCL